jgi:hypothetical protein
VVLQDVVRHNSVILKHQFIMIVQVLVRVHEILHSLIRVVLINVIQVVKIDLFPLLINEFPLIIE